MKQPSLDAQAGALWSQLWSRFYTIDDSRWAEQAPTLREMCRLSSALAQLCDAIQSVTRSSEEGEKG